MSINYWQALNVVTCMKLYNKPFTKSVFMHLINMLKFKVLDMGEMFAGIKHFVRESSK